MDRALRVLHLEDDPRDAELVRDLLETAGIVCEIARVQTCEDFVAALEEDGWDVILADYSLPSFDGMSALKIAAKRSPDVPFIFVSGALGEELAIEALKLGATDYVLKERLSRIVSAVRSALREAEHSAEHRQAEQALRASESRFRTFVDHASDAFILHDEDGTVLDVNRETCEALGYSRDELIGMTSADFDPDVKPAMRRRIRGRLDAGDTFSFETRHRRKDGTVFPVEVRVRAFRDGGRTFYISLSRDITERKRAEAERRQRERELRDLIETMPAIAWTVGADGLSAFASRRWTEYSGLPAQALSGSAWLAAVHPEDLDLHVQKWRASVATGAPFENEARLRRVEDGGYRWFLVRAVPLQDEDGKVLRWYGLATDIEDRKRAEQALRRSEAYLVEAQKITHTGSWAADPVNERTTYWSDEIFRIHGMDPGQTSAPGPEEYRAQFVHPEEAGRVREVWEQTYREKAEFTQDYRVVLTDGTVKHLHVIGHPVLDETGGLIQYVGTMADVTERKRTEQALRRSEAYLSDAQRLSHIGSWASSPTGRSTYWSEEMYRIYGLNPRNGPCDSDEFFSRIVHPEDRDRLREASERASRERVEFALEYRIVQPDGTIRHVHAIGHPNVDQTGQLIEYVGTVADVTQRKQAEAERAAHFRHLESMDRINRAMQGTNDLEQMMSDVLVAVLEIFDCDRAWLVYPCDPEAASWRPVMEHTRPEFPGAFAGGSDMPMDAEVASAFQSARASNGAVLFSEAYDLKLPAHVAERYSIRSQIAMALYPKVDKPYLFGLHQCSYARVWTAQEQRLFQEIGRRLADALTSLLMFRSLRESEAKLDEAQRIAHVGYWEYDIDTNRVTLSDEARRIYGVEQRDLAHWQERLRELVHPDDRVGLIQAFAAAVECGSRFGIECRLVHPNGELRVVQKRAYATCDESGRPRRVFGMVQDVTERKLAEAERTKLEERLRQAEKMEAVGRFASGIAHDFNNVLGGIMAFGELLLDDAPEDAPRKRYAQNVLVAATRGRDLVDQILAFTRSQRSKRARVDVCSTVVETLELVRSSLPRSVTLHAALPDMSLVVIGDATQLHQIVMNLCRNSIDAMSGGGTLHVTITHRAVDADSGLSHGTLRSGAHVCLRVEDTGCGMDEATLARIFEPFFTTKEIGRGTGLGLALVYAIVSDFGGAIDVKSVPDKGSTFSIYIPMADVTCAAVATA